MLKAKKIVVIGPCYPYRGGIATFVSFLCNLLSKESDVHLLNYSLLYPSVLFPGRTQYDESKELIFSFKSERIFSSLNPFSWRKTAKRIHELNPDVIIMDWWNPFFGICFRGLYFFLNKSFRNRILIVAENVVSHEGRFLDKYLTQIGISIANSYIVLSDKVSEQIKYFSNNKKIYKSNLPIYDDYISKLSQISRDEVCPSFLKDDFVMLFFGYIRKYKGLDIAIESMPIILKLLPNARLLIVGESYDDWKYYQDMIDRLNLNAMIQVVSEYVPNEAVGKYFTVSDLVLLPYRSATQSGILNIAYGFKKPVVATNVGGFIEFVDHKKTGIIVHEVTPQSFANGVIEFYETMKDLPIGKNIENVIAVNSFEKIREHVHHFYTSILNGK
jgi:glycosyltransferase involved in cell wall biosynthesis